MGRKGGKYGSLTTYQKKILKRKKEENPRLTQEELKKWVKNEFNVDIDRTTVSKILSDSKIQTEVHLPLQDCDKKRIRRVKFPELDTLLKEWFFQMESITTITDMMVVEKGKTIAKNLNISEKDLCFSDGWLEKFKSRHGIKCYRKFGEAASMDFTIVLKEVAYIRDEIDKYDPNNVYNFDETGLFFRMEPDATLARQRLFGDQKNKERITIGFCVNATGTHKLPPLVIGKYLNHHCFKNVNLRNVGVTYRANSKALMNATVFQKWLTNFDQLLSLESCQHKILLLLDNAISHNVERLNLKNIKLLVLPMSTTSHLQPLDAGIIPCFKRKYRRNFLRCLINEWEENFLASSKLDILGGIRLAVEAWNEISPETIKNCWRQTGIVKKFEMYPDLIKVENEEESDLSAMSCLISSLKLNSPMSVSEFVNVPEERCIEEIMITSNKTDEEGEGIEDSDETEEPSLISHNTAIESCNKLIHYFEQQPTDCSKDVLYLYKLKNEIISKNSSSQKLT